MRRSGLLYVALVACGHHHHAPADAPDAVDPTALVRVSQIGFAPDAPKRALVMSAQADDGLPFRVRADDGSVAFAGTLSGSRGTWSASYPHVYELDFTPLTAAGSYHVEALGASSPAFRIAAPAELYAPLAADALAFFRAQRDGADVDPTILSRMPSHLLDRTAATYAPPTYSSGEVLAGSLAPLGGTIDASGGWFDAGDYLKFVETASYVEVALLLVARDAPSSDALAEARRGLDWLLRMWDDSTATLYYQVGIGAGNANVNTDHDVWRLPEADDANAAPAGDPSYYIAHRPVFRAAAAGSMVSPNLAGRLAAAFALGSIVFASDAALSASCAAAARHVYDLADTSPGQLLTASPFSFYPETSHTDDLELGGAELAVALATSDPTAARGYLTAAAQHAMSYTERSPLNLYDVGGLAHMELYRALTLAGDPPGLAVTRAQLVAKTSAILDAAVEDPFGFAAAGASDPVPFTLGFAVLASLVDEALGQPKYAALEQHELDWALGANAWGTTFVVAAGTTFPHCLQHQVGNLVGALDGSAPLVRGAVVDGPADLTGGLASFSLPTGARPCAAGGFTAFDGSAAGQQYVDRAEVYTTSEPADDYVAVALLAWLRASR